MPKKPPAPSTPRNPAQTRQKLVEATLCLMLRQGFHATTVDQICAQAGLTKGSFFHHFKTKEDIGRAALDAFADMGTQLYSAAWQEPAEDPLDEIHRLFDIMIGFTQDPSEPCVCMVGMMSQELSRTNDSFRQACAGHLTVWANMLKDRLAAAKALRPHARDFDPDQVAWYLNSLWQGSMLIGKALENPEIIVTNLRLARIWVDELLGEAAPDSRSEGTGQAASSAN